MFSILNMLQPVTLKRFAIYSIYIVPYLVYIYIYIYIYSAPLLSDQSVHLNHINTTEFNDSLILTNSPSYIGRF